MATDGDVDTSRQPAQTYVPAYQKSEWQRHADELDMSLSEYVRSMVQAGRSDITPPSTDADSSSRENGGETPSSASHPQGSDLEDRVVTILSDDGWYDWDELVDALTDDLEDRLEEILQRLQADDRVRYSGRNGGYTLE